MRFAVARLLQQIWQRRVLFESFWDRLNGSVDQVVGSSRAARWQE
jgi:hypothetical protein